MGAFGILRDASGRLLVVHNHPSWAESPFWSFPGGTVDPGELPSEAMRREVEEETGLIVGEYQLAWMTVTDLAYDNSVGILSYFEVTSWSGEPVCDDVAGAVTELRWVTPAEVVELIIASAPGITPHAPQPLLAYLGRSDDEPRALWELRRSVRDQTPDLAG